MAGIASSEGPIVRDSASAPSAQDAALFSLGGAVWGFQPAVGYYSPQQQVPEAWLLVLVEHFADAEFYLCLFRASRGARDWVLETAPTARYSLVSSDVDMWQHQLSTLRERLQTRGSKPVRLRVPASQQHAAALAALPGVLAGVGACITELTLRGPDRTPQQPVHPIAVEHAAAAFLRAVAPHLPNLSTLTLTNIPCELPSPSVLPQLKDLSMDQLQPNRIIGRSVVRLFTQLTALALQHAEAAESAVPALLRLCQPSNTTTTLVRLSIHAPLTDELLACLLISAPCLTELSVGDVAIRSSRHCTAVWAVQELCVWAPSGNIQLHTLARLPRRQQGQVILRHMNPFRVIMYQVDIDSAEGIAPEVVQRFAEWRFEGCGLDVVAGSQLQPDSHPTALLNVLRQLTQLQTVSEHDAAITKYDGQMGELLTMLGQYLERPPDSAWLINWQWSPQLASDAATLLPALPHLRLSIAAQSALTDQLLETVRQLGSNLHCLYVDHVALQSNQHDSAAWPCDYLAVTQGLDVADLVKLAPGPLRKLEAKHLFSGPVLDQVDMGRLMVALRQIEWQAQSQMLIKLTCPPGSSMDHALLQAQLSMLRAMRLSRRVPMRYPEALLVCDWAMTKETMTTLRNGLPHWSSALCIATEQWPLQPAEYRTLAQYIPVSYKRWFFRVGKLSLAQAEQIVLGAKEHRVSLGSTVTEPLIVTVADTETADHLTEILGGSEHIIVRG